MGLDRQIVLNGVQVRALIDALHEHADGDEIVITEGSRGSIIVGFTLATVTISEDGESEEN